MKTGASGFVVALLQVLVGLGRLLVDDALAFNRGVDKHRRPIPRGRLEGRGSCLRPVPLQGADRQQDLRGLMLVGPQRILDPLLAGLYPRRAQGVVLLHQAEGVVQNQGQHAVRQLMAGDGIAQEAFQGAKPRGATVETMHAGEVACLEGLILVDPIIHLRVGGGHAQAQAGRVIPGLGKVQLMETLGCAPGLVGIEHADRPGITGEGQPCQAVFVGLEVEEGSRGIVIGRDAARCQQGLVGNRWRIRIELAQITVGGDLVGVPDRAVQQDIQVAGTQGAQAQAGLDLAVLGDERRGHGLWDQGLAQGQDR
ncbi:hypothetical protein D3C84_286330 [compost metagenome]